MPIKKSDFIKPPSMMDRRLQTRSMTESELSNPLLYGKVDERIVDSVLTFHVNSLQSEFEFDPYDDPWRPPLSHSVTGLRLKYFNGDDDNRLIIIRSGSGAIPIEVARRANMIMFDAAFAALDHTVTLNVPFIWKYGEPWRIMPLRPANAVLVVYAKRSEPMR